MTARVISTQEGTIILYQHAQRACCRMTFSTLIAHFLLCLRPADKVNHNTVIFFSKNVTLAY